MSFDRLKIFTGNANAALTQEICQCLGVQAGDATVRTFSDGEIHLQVHENVRGADVFVVQPTCTPVEKNLFELLLMADALKRASADRITAVLPYYGYARQDRKDRPRVPISAKLVASLMETSGIHRVLALDLHAAPIQGFFDVPVDHLFAAPVLIDAFNHLAGEDLVVVSPDAGGVERFFFGGGVSVAVGSGEASAATNSNSQTVPTLFGNFLAFAAGGATIV